MPNPTRAQILNAHEALEELKNVALSAADFCGDTEKYLAWKSEIIAALPPKPAPTMAEVEWDDDKHYLAEAEHDVYVVLCFCEVMLVIVPFDLGHCGGRFGWKGGDNFALPCQVLLRVAAEVGCAQRYVL